MQTEPEPMSAIWKTFSSITDNVSQSMLDVEEYMQYKNPEFSTELKYLKLRGLLAILSAAVEDLKLLQCNVKNVVTKQTQYVR